MVHHGPVSIGECWVADASGKDGRRSDAAVCGFAALASRIVISETWGRRKQAGPERPFSPQTLAAAMGMPVSRVRDRLSGASAIRPLEARAMIAHTGDVRLAHWLLEGTDFTPALRPVVIAPARGVRTGLTLQDDARVFTSAVELAHQAHDLLAAAIGAAADLALDAADRAKLKEELKGVETALVTLQAMLDVPAGRP